MTSKKFIKKLKGLIDDSGEFITDVVDIPENRDLAKKAGFDGIILVCGEDDTETFNLLIAKV